VAQKIIQSVFPGRKVIGIDCTNLIYGMGALHCVMQQQPAIIKKSIDIKAANKKKLPVLQ
jgi:agmatine deiminase